MPRTERHQLIRALFDEYIALYAGRDDRLTAKFSDCFSGFTGGGDFLVKDRAAWVDITRQDFAQVPDSLRIELLDISMQDLAEDVVTVTGFFHIHLPIKDHILSQETARLLLIFRQEHGRWMIVNSTISIPYHLVEDGEVYPLKNLHDRNRELETVIEERTRALAEANAKLERLSNTDGLTGIANRRHFDAMLAQEWNRARRSGTPLGLILLDVDHFKHYNDESGHVAGDFCLKALAEAMVRAERRSGRLAARYGGEEFAMLLPDTDLRGALETARRIQAEVWKLAMSHPQSETGIVTVSLGVASCVPVESMAAENFVREADSALYAAKRQGRNRISPAPDASACPRRRPGADDAGN
ncbi:MAG: diguanylate cyclase [Desulfovibrio sp.]|jgi:diguanylate cyclase (GGDEF)-like protein|nr:diguanylate cyclase [Desulfovibrio sp.]